jgi:hypothetical protein
VKTPEPPAPSKSDTPKQEHPGQNHQFKNNQRRAYKKPTEKEGKCDDLAGYTYDCSDSRLVAADMYTKNTKEIAEHVGRTFKYGVDAKKAITTLLLPVFVEPTNPADKATRTQIRVWEKTVDEFVKQQTHLEQNVKTICPLVLGQCTDAMRAKLESQSGYRTIEDESKGIELLKMIRTIMFNFQSQKYGPWALHEAKVRFLTFKQDKHMTCAEYQKRFLNNVQVLLHCLRDIGADSGLVDATLNSASPTALTRDTATAAELLAAEDYTHEKYLACAFLFGCDRHQFGKLIEDMENNFTLKINKWPKTVVTEAYNLLIRWKQDP